MTDNQTAHKKWRPVNLPAWLMVACVRLYQKVGRPVTIMLGVRCRFHPSCSEYFIGAVKKYGVVRGAWRGFGRLLRCNPLFPGGIDDP